MSLPIIYSLLLALVALGVGFVWGCVYTRRNARYLDIQDDWRVVLGLDK
jgi:hypothetical protein